MGTKNESLVSGFFCTVFDTFLQVSSGFPIIPFSSFLGERQTASFVSSSIPKSRSKPEALWPKVNLFLWGVVEKKKNFLFLFFSEKKDIKEEHSAGVNNKLQLYPFSRTHFYWFLAPIIHNCPLNASDDTLKIEPSFSFFIPYKSPPLSPCRIPLSKVASVILDGQRGSRLIGDFLRKIVQERKSQDCYL